MQSGDHLNIISFDVPYPADYGGAIDVFYKVRSLWELGIKIHLHCFEYGRGQQPELLKYCEEVFYYERKLRIIDFLSLEPFIIKTRKSARLIQNLKSNDFPILCEGYHSCSILDDKHLTNRKIYLRPANVEKNYYQGLERVEGNLLKKIYFKAESIKLALWESKLNLVNSIIPISDSDRDYFMTKFPDKTTETVFAFHEYESIDINSGIGDYVLFHGNLSVAENFFVAENIVSEVAPRCKTKFIIAGKDPQPSLIRKCAGIQNVELVANPSFSQMEGLISGAHIILLITNQETGVKLKLINSLFRGRHLIANSKMVTGTGIETMVELVTFNDDIIYKINELTMLEFGEKEIIRRCKYMPTKFFNKSKALQLLALID